MKIAAVQMDVALQQVDANLERMIARLRETRENGATLTVFPECALCGYCFASLDEAHSFAQPIPGPGTESMRRACAELGGYAVFGMLESDGQKKGSDPDCAEHPEGRSGNRGLTPFSAQRLFNAAVLVGPAGVIGSYRKVHLPYLGVDMFTTPGDRPFAVYSAGELRVGLNICYDAAFPEATRALALLGADLIVLPTNWPPGSECTAASVINARGLENAVYYLAANRVGTERGFTFIGRSKIVDPAGQTIADARTLGEEILYADVDPAKARQKHIIRVPDKHEIDRFADRRPEMYGLLTQPHSLKRPRDNYKN